MIISSRTMLTNHKRDNPEQEYYACFTLLQYPVRKVKYISKKYVYWEDDTKHPYPSNASGYVLCTTENEAWDRYKNMYLQRKKNIEEIYLREQNLLKNAEKILKKIQETNPEFLV